MAQISFCLSLQHTGLLPLAGYCDTFVENLTTVLFWTDKIKAAHGEKIFSGDKSLFHTQYWRICHTLRHRIVSPEIINLIFGDKSTCCGYSQSDYYLIHLADNYRSYLISFQGCSMLKILRNKNDLKHCIFHCKMMHLVFPYNDQYLIS